MTNSPVASSELDMWIKVHAHYCTQSADLVDEMSRHETGSARWVELFNQLNDTSVCARSALEMVRKAAS